MAATDLEKLVVQLSADIKTFENAFNKAVGLTNKRAKVIEQRFAKMNKNIAAGYGGLVAGASKVFALMGGAAGFRSLSDSGTRITNSLKVAGLAGAELEIVYQRLLKSAQENAAPLESLVELYGRVALAQGELGVSSEQVESFVKNIGVALRASGKSSAEASGALLQLSQSLGAGIVRSEEFASIQEGAPTILQAAAAGIREAGGSIAKLRQIMLDGNLSSRAFFDGISAGTPILKQKLSGSILTIDQRLENLRTSLTDAVRRFNESSGAAETFGREIDRLANFIRNVNFDAMISEMQDLIGQINAGTAAVNNFMAAWGQKLGISKAGDAIVNLLPGDETFKSYFGGGLTVYSADAVKRRIDDAFSEQLNKTSNLTSEAIRNSVLGKGDVAASGAKGKRLPAGEAVKPISLSDPQYRVSTEGKDGGRSKGGKGSRENDYEREITQIKERTAALQAETAAQAAVNPLVNDYGYAVEYARAKQELLTAAQKAGVTVTPQLAGEVDKLAAAYASSVVASEQLVEKQDEIRRRAEDAMNAAKDVTRDMIDGFLEGEKAADIFAGALKRIGNALIDDVLNSIFKINNASGGGGLLSGILGIFGGGGGFKANSTLGEFIGAIPGRKNGGPVRAGQPYIVGEKRAELFVPNQSGRIIPKVPTIPNLSSLAAGRQQVVNATFAPVYNVQGSGPEIDQLRQQMAQDKRDLPAVIIKTYRQAKATRNL